MIRRLPPPYLVMQIMQAVPPETHVPVSDALSFLLYSCCACLQAKVLKSWDDLTTEATSSTFSSAVLRTSSTPPSPSRPVSGPKTITTKSRKSSPNAAVVLLPCCSSVPGFVVFLEHTSRLQVYFARSFVFHYRARVQTIPTKCWDHFTTEATSSTFSEPSHTVATAPLPQPKPESEPTTTRSPKPSTNDEVSFVALLQQCVGVCCLPTTHKQIAVSLYFVICILLLYLCAGDRV